MSTQIEKQNEQSNNATNPNKEQIGGIFAVVVTILTFTVSILQVYWNYKSYRFLKDINDQRNNSKSNRF